MKIGVCLKEVPDTASKIELAADNHSINDTNLKYVINPYDEYALEEALRIKDKAPETEVVVFCLGPEKAAESIRKALAMGADRALHLQASIAFGEGLQVANLLSQMIRKENVDLLFAGRTAVDDDGTQVGTMIAGLLNWPQAMNVIDLTIDTKMATVTREIEGGSKEIIELTMPAVIAMTKGVHEPRYASLKGIMAAKKKEIKIIPMAELANDIAATFKIEGYVLPPKRQAVKMISGDPAQAATELVRLLRQEAKVI